MEKTLYYKRSFPYKRLSASISIITGGIEVSILSTSLRWLIRYNVLIGDAEGAEEFLEAAEAEDEFLEATEAFAV